MLDIDIYIEDAGTFTIDGVTYSVGYAGDMSFDVVRDVVDHRHLGNEGGYDIWGDVFHYDSFDPACVWADDDIAEGHALHDAAVAAFAKWVEEGGAGILEEMAEESTH